MVSPLIVILVWCDDQHRSQAPTVNVPLGHCSGRMTIFHANPDRFPSYGVITLISNSSTVWVTGHAP